MGFSKADLSEYIVRVDDEGNVTRVKRGEKLTFDGALSTTRKEEDEVQKSYKVLGEETFVDLKKLSYAYILTSGIYEFPNGLKSSSLVISNFFLISFS